MMKTEILRSSGNAGDAVAVRMPEARHHPRARRSSRVVPARARPPASRSLRASHLGRSLASSCLSDLLDSSLPRLLDDLGSSDRDVRRRAIVATLGGGGGADGPSRRARTPSDRETERALFWKSRSRAAGAMGPAPASPRPRATPAVGGSFVSDLTEATREGDPDEGPWTPTRRTTRWARRAARGWRTLRGRAGRGEAGVIVVPTHLCLARRRSGGRAK